MVNFEGRKCSYIIAYFMSSTLHYVLSNVSHLKCREKYCLEMSATPLQLPSQLTRLSQDHSDNVVVAIVRGESLHFSIFLSFPGLTKVGLVQDTCKYEMYSGVPIFHCFSAIRNSWVAFLLLCSLGIDQMSTSINMCGQGHKLAEHLTGEECAQFIGRLPSWADVQVANDEGGLLKVDDLLQEMCRPAQRFLL